MFAVYMQSWQVSLSARARHIPGQLTAGEAGENGEGGENGEAGGEHGEAGGEHGEAGENGEDGEFAPPTRTACAAGT